MMMSSYVIGCYSLDLYCANHAADCVSIHEQSVHKWAEFPITFCGYTGGECRRQARKVGWRIYLREQVAFCPKCRHAKLSDVLALRAASAE